VGRVLLQDARQLLRTRAVLSPQRARNVFVILPQRRCIAAELLLLLLLLLLGMLLLWLLLWLQLRWLWLLALVLLAAQLVVTELLCTRARLCLLLLSYRPWQWQHYCCCCCRGHNVQLPHGGSCWARRRVAECHSLCRNSGGRQTSRRRVAPSLLLPAAGLQQPLCMLLGVPAGGGVAGWAERRTRSQCATHSAAAAVRGVHYNMRMLM
jgi:hypothetical protein